MKNILITTMLLILIFILAGCEDHDDPVRKEQTAPRNEKMNHYDYANSTDIYSSSRHFSIDGTKWMPLFLNESNEYALLSVNDSWLYYCESDEEGTGDLKRIPLKKGPDGRDRVDVSHKEKIRDTSNDQGFTVVGDYYAGISYGTVAVLYHMNTRETIRKKVPEAVQYPKDREMEDKKWYVLEQGDHWILWDNWEGGIFLQKIPSGELTVIKSKNIDSITTDGNNDFVFSDDRQSCFLYDIKKQEKKKWITKKEIQNAVHNSLKRSNKKMKAYQMDSLFTQNGRYYLQIRAEVAQNGTNSREYMILSKRNDPKSELTYEVKLNKVLQKKELGNKMKYCYNINEHWFLEDETRCYYFNEKSQLFKRVTEMDSERNILYAVSQEEFK